MLELHLDISRALHMFLELLPSEEKFFGEGKGWFVIHGGVMLGLWHVLWKILQLPSTGYVRPDPQSVHICLAWRSTVATGQQPRNSSLGVMEGSWNTVEREESSRNFYLLWLIFAPGFAPFSWRSVWLTLSP